MLTQKFETKILKDGTIKLPRLTMFKTDEEVDVIIMEKKTKKENISFPGKDLTAVDFFNKWVGVLKKGDDDYFQYIENKNK